MRISDARAHLRYALAAAIFFYARIYLPFFYGLGLATLQSPNFVSMFGQLQIRLTGIEPAMGCDAGPTY